MSTRPTAGAGAVRRRRLADELAAGGDLRGAAWRAAVEAVPREAFLTGRVYRPVRSGPTWWQPITPEQVGQDYWLDLAYQDVTWVTQLDGTDTPGSLAWHPNLVLHHAGPGRPDAGRPRRPRRGPGA